MTTRAAQDARGARQAERFIPHADALTQLPQPTEFKQVCVLPSLTLRKSGTYTDSMTARRIVRILIGVPLALAASWPLPQRAAAQTQAIQKSMYVSVVNAAGVPVPHLATTHVVLNEHR